MFVASNNVVSILVILSFVRILGLGMWLEYCRFFWRLVAIVLLSWLRGKRRGCIETVNVLVLVLVGMRVWECGDLLDVGGVYISCKIGCVFPIWEYEDC